LRECRIKERLLLIIRGNDRALLLYENESSTQHSIESQQTRTTAIVVISGNFYSSGAILLDNRVRYRTVADEYI